MSTNKHFSKNNSSTPISRRDFLRLSSLFSFGLMLPKGILRGTNFRVPGDLGGELLGRITTDGEKLYRSPDSQSRAKLDLFKDSVWRITSTAISDNDPSPNKVWYELDNRWFTHSKHVQPVYRKENNVVSNIPEEGCLGEVTIPFVDARRTADENGSVAYRLYYASTYWVINHDKDDLGKSWYQLMDDWNYSSFWVPAESIRLVPASELSPISPDVPWDEKSIDVDLSEQTMTAYEGGKVVFMSRISSGSWAHPTPRGYYRTSRKRPCRHMVNSVGGYDLPGVPWVSYFTSSGIAFHGAYWHNDYGVRHSHGCINLPPLAAKWVYLWTTPAVPAEKYVHFDSKGTRLIVH